MFLWEGFESKLKLIFLKLGIGATLNTTNNAMKTTFARRPR